jgi:UDP-N-acetylmuramate dehydrogenase
MIKIENDVSLRPYNTFGMDVRARYFCRIQSIEEFRELLSSPQYQNTKHLMLGGGSNILFTGDYEGMIIRNEIKGIEIVNENDDRITIKSGAGEGWHDLVMHCVHHHWGGIENLSLIPGTVGAAPMQNIGAYGVEIKDVIESVEGIDTTTGQVRSFDKEECQFGYRESVFKHELKEKYFISSVTLSLTKKNHLLNINYGAIQDTLKQQQINDVTISAISKAVISIRQQKLPDPLLIGNAGSFFKNPTIDPAHFQRLKNQHTSIPSYPTENQYVKVPAGWLIEQCGWKGKRVNNIGVHTQQALVLVNYGSGNGNEIHQLAQAIQSSVKEKFDIQLSTEVNII